MPTPPAHVAQQKRDEEDRDAERERNRPGAAPRDESTRDRLAVVERMKGSLVTPAQGGFIPPKQDPNEDAAAYSRRVADAREAYKQKSAMKK